MLKMNLQNYHHIRLNVFYMHARVTMICMNEFQAFVFSQLLTNFLIIQLSLLHYFLYVFLCCSLTDLPPTSHFGHLVCDELSYILTRWPNYNNLLFYKTSHMAFTFDIILRSIAESISSILTMHIHLNILLSLFSNPDYIFLFNWPRLTPILDNTMHISRIKSIFGS